MKTAIPIAALAVTLSVPAAAQQAENPWLRAAEAAIAEKLARQPITNRAKNVIVMIADGNGVGTNYATRLWVGQKNGGYGDEAVLPYEAMPYLAMAKTYNTNAQTPDSAGTATAILSGVKTKAGVLGVDESLARGDCDAVGDAAVPSIAEILAEEGKAVGIVTTTRITHATPGAVYAKSADRNFENDSDLPEGCDQPDIASQLISGIKSGTVDVALGGGRRNFIGADVSDDEGESGRRADDRDLIAEARQMGVQYAWNTETAEGLELDGTPILGLFESSHMQYEADRTDEPSLAEMTGMAIESLRNNDEGYFLLVEAGRVDHANHATNLYRTVTDGEAFAEAVKSVLEMTDPEETLVIVTADHEHALAFNGYCGRGSPITGLCYGVDETGTGNNGAPQTGADGKPYTVAGYLNGGSSILSEEDGWTGSRGDLTAEETQDPDFQQQALIPRSSETHSGEDVAIYARGPWAHLIDGTVEQNYIFSVMRYATRAQ